MKMKIPNTPVGNGYYNQEVNIIPYLSDPSVANSDEAESPTLAGDFSEYLWMENEEEFDQQVMKQLEEEALMEQCIEAMLEDERDPAGQQQVATAPQAWSNGDLPPSLTQSLDSLCVSDDLAKGSKLNPNATEFVPRQQVAAPILPRPLITAPVEGQL